MPSIRRFRIPALICAITFLFCEVISRPYAEMGICDDWSYISVAHHLASSGHIVYNGWVNPIVGWQLYLGAAFIKLFGFSFTAPRMSVLMVGVLLTWLLQRTLVRSGISEYNAVFGTLVLVLSPLFMALSVSYMTDIAGLFALVVCLYACLRALQSRSSRSTFAWICAAILANVIFGSSRQIAWLGALVMVPSTLWILHRQQRFTRRLLLAALSVILLGWLTILLILLWFRSQPYSIPEHLLPKTFAGTNIFWQFACTFLDIPFLILPVFLLFYPALRNAGRKPLALAGTASVVYLLLIYHWRHFTPNFLLEPTQIDWVTICGFYKFVDLKAPPPLFLYPSTQALLTAASIGGLISLLIAAFKHRPAGTPAPASQALSRKQAAILLGPYTVIYGLVLVQRATQVILDRYTLPLLVFAIIYMLRLYQQVLRPRVPSIAWLAVCLFAAYGIISTHNLFALYRARVALAAEVRSAGIPDTSVDNGWEFNGYTELQHAAFVNDPRLVLPVNSYTPMPERVEGPCSMLTPEEFPHLSPRFAISFDPNLCLGKTDFPPMTYSRWPALHPGTLYVIGVTPPPKH